MCPTQNPIPKRIFQKMNFPDEIPHVIGYILRAKVAVKGGLPRPLFEPLFLQYLQLSS